MKKTAIVMPCATFTEDGVQEHPSVRLLARNDHPFYHHLPAGMPSKQEFEQAAEAVFRHAPLMNDPKITVPLLGFMGAVPSASLIRAAPGWGGFPTLNVSGQAGSGKTSEGVLAWAVSGVSRSLLPFEVTMTPHARLVLLSLGSCPPVLFDEMRRGDLSATVAAAFNHDNRTLYGGGTVTKGTKDQGVRTYRLCATEIVLGEDRLRGRAQEDRIIPLYFAAETLKDKACEDAYKLAAQAPLEAFAPYYWVWTLKRKNELEELEKARRRVRSVLKKWERIVNDRITNNISIDLYGWRRLLSFADDNGIKPAIDDGPESELWIESVLDEIMPKGIRADALDELMVFLSNMAANGILKPDVHFKLRTDGLLVLPLGPALLEANRYAISTDTRENLLSEDAYRRMVGEKAEQPESYIRKNTDAAWFDDEKTGAQRQRRGVLFDPGVMEKQLGIDKDIWKKDEFDDSEAPPEKEQHGEKQFSLEEVAEKYLESDS